MLRSLVFVLALIHSGVLHAQDNSDLSLGQTTGPAIGESYMRDIVGEWQVRCVKAPEGRKDKCHIYQPLSQTNGNPIAEIMISVLDDHEEAIAGAVIVTPLGILLHRGLQISVDGGEPTIYGFNYCTRVGCFAKAGLTGPDVFAFERGTEAAITITALSRPNEPIEIFVPLDGFTTAYDSLFD